MFTRYLIVSVCSSPLPASGCRSRDRRGGEEVQTGRHTVTDGRRGSRAYNSAHRFFWSSDLDLAACTAAGFTSTATPRRDQIFLAFSCLVFTRSAITIHLYKLTALNVGLLLFVEREMSLAWHTWHHTTKACLPWCLLGRLFRGNSSYCSVPSAIVADHPPIVPTHHPSFDFLCPATAAPLP